MRDHKLYLKDILEAMSSIERFVTGVDFEDFKKNDEKSSAVIKKFEIIGEATKNIPENIRQMYPDVPWKEMAMFRDKLVHFYFGVKYEIVWATIKDVIPQLKPEIRKILNDLEDGE
ncbi:MAG: DUF86 domain-containing protein [Candidatus Methanoperedens sp.]|nr:DUF86 domain-containing protein [Candidatus Methanoperedens sp.]